MKKTLSGIIGSIIIIGFVFLGVTQLWGTTASANSSKKTITIGTTGTSFPTSYKKGNKLVGFDVQLINKAAKDLGYKPKWVTGEYDGLLADLDGGKVDTVANDVAITPARSKKYTFSTPYNVEETAIAVNKSSKYKTIHDLDGKTVSTGAASNNTDNLKKYDPKIKLRTFDARDQFYEALLAGHVDGTVDTRNNLKAIIKAKGYHWRVVSGTAATVKIALPFAKNAHGKKLNKQFSKEIKKLKQNGTVSKLSKQYFGYDVTKDDK